MRNPDLTDNDTLKDLKGGGILYLRRCGEI